MFKLMQGLATLALLLAGTAQAGLYPPAAPPDSAFVRVFNAGPEPRLAVKIGTQSLGELAPLSASAYVFMPPGEQSTQIGNSRLNLKLQSRRCYTAVAAADGIHLLDQDCFNSQLKSLLSLYNLIDGSTLSLKAGEQGPAVIESVKALAAGHREVNPVRATLSVYDGDRLLGEAPPQILERGKVYSLFVTGTASAPVLTWVLN